MITVVGWPRSGTHWLKAMLEGALGEELGHSHHVPEQEGQYVLVIRDPRDSFASHWRLYQADGGQASELEIVDLLLKGQMESHQGWNTGWVPHTERLLALEAQGVPLVRYEELYAYPIRVIGDTIRRLGYEVSAARIVRSVVQARGVRHDPSTLPMDGAEMGRPGKGRTLHPRTMRALMAYCGPLMERLGYDDGR